MLARYQTLKNTFEETRKIEARRKQYYVENIGRVDLIKLAESILRHGTPELIMSLEKFDAEGVLSGLLAAIEARKNEVEIQNSHHRA